MPCIIFPNSRKVFILILPLRSLEHKEADNLAQVTELWVPEPAFEVKFIGSRVRMCNHYSELHAMCPAFVFRESFSSTWDS